MMFANRRGEEQRERGWPWRGTRQRVGTRVVKGGWVDPCGCPSRHLIVSFPILPCRGIGTGDEDAHKGPHPLPHHPRPYADPSPNSFGKHHHDDRGAPFLSSLNCSSTFTGAPRSTGAICTPAISSW